VYDYPQLAIGDVPVIYPYIVDNIGEALQTSAVEEP
jgi:cobaltochelatase CobN